MNAFIFYLLGIIASVSAFRVVTARNVFHSALFLVLTLFSVAGIYVLLAAEFLAGVQVLIYVGAITILIIFAIMLTHQISNKSIRQTNEQVLPAVLIVLIFFAMSIATLLLTSWPTAASELPSDNIFRIGQLLMTTYVIPFEVVSIVLLVALIGAIVISRREKRSGD